jgi:hypothetical protein
MKPPQFARTKYDALVADAVLSGAEMDLATRSARKQELDIEQVLEADFDVPQAAIGAALAKHGPPDTGPGLRPQSGWGSRSHLPNEIGVFRSSILRDFKTPNFERAELR